MPTKEPQRNVYVGHRYVPMIMGEWDQTFTYEGLSIVTYLGNSYTSKKRVPIGIEILNEAYWVITGNYNAQIEQYRQEVKQHKIDTAELLEEQLGLMASKEELRQLVINVKSFGAKGDGVTNDTAAFIEAIEFATLLPESTIFVPGSFSDYLIKETLYIPHTLNVKMDGRILFDSSQNLPGIVIGDSANLVLYKQLQVRIKRKEVANWLDENSIGVKIVNPDTCKIDLTTVIGFTIGVQYVGSGRGAAYNNTSIGYLVNNKIHLDLTNETKGWCNENVFIGGRMTSHTTEKMSISRYGVRITSKDSQYITNNNNMFIKPCFELQVPTTGEAIPILIEHGNQNTFDKIRNESNSKTTVRTLNDSSENEIFTGYGSIEVEDFGKYPSTFYGSTRNSLIDNGQNVIFDSGALHKKACYYNEAGNVSIPGVHFTGSTTASHSATQITIGNDYIEMPSTRAMGVFVDTSNEKRFVIRKDVVKTNGGRIAIRCYDVNGNILNGLNEGHPFVKSTPVNTPSYTGDTVLGGAYRTGADSSLDWYIKVAENVVKIAVLVVGGTKPIQIRSFSISSVGGGSPAVWTGYDEFLSKNNIALTPPSMGTWEAGKIVYNAAPTLGSPKGWRKVTSGDTNVLGTDWEVI